jgi:hypothetical protein
MWYVLSQRLLLLISELIAVLLSRHLQIDALQMLGTVPNVVFSRNLFKHTQRNLIPVENTLHSRMDLEFPGLLLAPSNGELISIIATLEEHLVAAETAVEAEHAPAYTHFHIDLDRVIDATGATSRYVSCPRNIFRMISAVALTVAPSSR